MAAAAATETSHRRPSTVADQALMSVGAAHRPPVLADTHRGPFSQTTDCVTLTDNPTTTCQAVQQRVYTDAASRQLLAPRVSAAVARVSAAGRGLRPITTSIDEGVELDSGELDGDREPVAGGGGGGGRGATIGLPDISPLMFGCLSQLNSANQPLNMTTGSPFTSFDSNIEVDVLTSSPCGSTILPADSSLPAAAAETQGDGVDETDEPKDTAASLVNFREGRRASDGLVAHSVLAFRQHLKESMKTKGIAEIRKELENLQNLMSDHCAGGDHNRGRRCRYRGGKVAAYQQRSLEETVLVTQPTRLVLKRKSLPTSNYAAAVPLSKLLMQKCALRYGDASMEDRSAAAGQPYCLPHHQCLLPSHIQPWRASTQPPSATTPPLQMSSSTSPQVCTQHQLHMQFQQLQIGARAVRPSTPPITGCHDDGISTRQMLSAASFSGMPSSGDSVADGLLAWCQSVDGRLIPVSAGTLLEQHHSLGAIGERQPCSLASLTTPTCRSYGGIASSQAGGLAPTATGLTIPTCHSQESLHFFASASMAAAIQRQQGNLINTAGLGVLTNPPSGLLSDAATSPASQSVDETRRHMVRRTLYRLAPQQTLISPCDELESELRDNMDQT